MLRLWLGWSVASDEETQTLAVKFAKIALIMFAGRLLCLMAAFAINSL